MKNKLLIAGLILILAAAACLCNGGNGGTGSTGDTGSNGGSGGSAGSGDNGSSGQSEGGSAPDAIGQIEPTSTVVERNHGSVTASQPFYRDDSIGLFNGGECRLDFVGGLSLNLFNDTEVRNIQSEAASDSSVLARMRLEFGGFTGVLTASGRSVPFETPAGVTITVYGTQFFIVYDPATSITTVGNFQGGIEVQAGSGPALPVPEETMRQVLPGGEISQERPLEFSMEEFAERSRQAGSPVAALNELTVTIIEPEPIPVEDFTPPAFELLGLEPPSIVYGSECPGTVGETRLTMRILDENQIVNPMVEWELNGVFETRPMERLDDQTFTVVIGPLQDFGVLNIVVSAEDAFGNLGKSELIQVEVLQCIG